MANACLKTTFCVVSALCAITGLALAGGGIWYSLKLKQITDLRTFESYQLDFNVHWPQVLPYVFVGVGILSLLVACCGLCGGGAGSKACLITYNVCAIIVILAMVGSGIAAIMVATEESDKFVKDTLHNVFREVIAGKYHVREEFSEVETSLHCCGADSPKNYDDNRIPYPKSCCDSGTFCSNGLLNPRRGCIEVVSAYTKWAFYVGTAGCGVVAVLAFFSLCLSFTLIRRINAKIVV